MPKRFLALLVVAVIAASACAGAATTAPTAAPTEAATAAPTEAATAAPTEAATAAPTEAATAAPVEVKVITDYKPEAVGNTGGTLILGEWQFPSTNIVYDNSATTVEAMGPSQWGLWNSAADYKYYPQLTTVVPTVENGGVVVRPDGGMDLKIELIPGAQWSDGQPITCQDVADMVTWMMDPAQVGTINGVFGYEHITGVDGGTGSSCVAHFDKQFESYLGLWVPLVPSHYTKSFPVAEASTKLYPASDITSGVYSGPYMPTKWIDGQEIDFVPNPKFWETIKKGTAPFDSVIFKYYDSADAMIAGYNNGEVDVAMNLNHSDLPKLTALPQDQVDAIDGTTYEQHSWQRAAMVANWGEDGANAILEALHYAIDKQAIADRVLGGYVKPICNYVAPLMWFYADTGACYEYDAAKANSILDAAGFTAGADGTREKAGKKLEFLGCTSASRQYRIDTLALLASQLQQVGIKINVTPVPSTPNLFGGWTEVADDTPCNITHGNHGVAEFAWVSSPDPAGSYTTYTSFNDPTTNPTHSGNNITRVNSPEVDKIMDTAQYSVDFAVIKQAMSEFQKLYADPANAFPEIPLYLWKTVILKNPKMHNVVNNATNATNTWNLEDWWRAQ
jgi:peptide/nickel transport system substrate-binding protein